MAYSQSPKKTGLPREVLKWLQSLDLSFFPKKRAQRLFQWVHSGGNIFLVLPKGFSYAPMITELHWLPNYPTGPRLRDFFVKQSISLLKDVIDGTIHCKPGAAELLVQEIYTILTNRRIQTIQRVEQDFTDKAYQDQLPMVARATASVAIKSNLSLSEVIAEPNIITNQRKVLAITHGHIEQRKEERTQDPKRFDVKATLGEQAVRLPPLLAHQSEPNLQMNTSQAAC